MKFAKDSTKDVYERQVFSFLDMTGAIGGMLEVLRILGAFIVGSCTTKIFLYSIFSNLYQVRDNKSCIFANNP